MLGPYLFNSSLKVWSQTREGGALSSQPCHPGDDSTLVGQAQLLEPRLPPQGSFLSPPVQAEEQQGWSGSTPPGVLGAISQALICRRVQG